MSVGIDDISFATSSFYLDLQRLADVQGIEADKFYQGIGQEKMGIVAPDEDVVTLAAAAAEPLLQRLDPQTLDTLIFATETGVDQSKAAGIFVHRLLGLSPRCRVVEMKQACYSATAAVQMACALVAREPQRRVLVLASDIARYDLGSSGEATQGCGAAALVISARPRVVEIDPWSGHHTEDVMDFWRPNYRATALVDGKYSTKIYLKALKQAWAHYQEVSGLDFDALDHICYHLPFSRMAEKAQLQLAKFAGTRADTETLLARVEPSVRYNRLIGNSYTASLYVALVSLLDHSDEDLSGTRLGFFSYGSGCVAEFFSGRLVPGYADRLHRERHQSQLVSREALDYEAYLRFYGFEVPTDGGDHSFEEWTRGPFRLAGIQAHKRIYQPRS